MQCLLQAVARIHKDHIIHRDIKPANFLYDFPGGKCALVDFGLSQTEEEIKGGFSKYAQKMSHSAEARRESSRGSLTNLKSRINLVAHFSDLVVDTDRTLSTQLPALSTSQAQEQQAISVHLPPPPPPQKGAKKDIRFGRFRSSIVLR